ncbi:MAG: 3-hydroxyacyl-ACP dehydratase FabZ [Zetaproteobacteria bacterium]|nr:3-hydroxyacyl-ACP dehydratase FabZ [Zetaproteobacteria bacterium]
MSVKELPNFPMDIPEMIKWMPHRPPFLLVDRVLKIEPGKGIHARKCISGTENVLMGHFPDQPIYPGVLTIEAIAQAATIFGQFMLPHGASEAKLTGISNARFRRSAIPGDVVDIYVDMTRMKSSFFWFKGRAEVEGEEICSAEISALLK